MKNRMKNLVVVLSLIAGIYGITEVRVENTDLTLKHKSEELT